MSDEPIVLRQMGSFHVGGRLHEVSGLPVRDLVFSTGGAPTRFDPNGAYQVEQMYAQYFLVANRRGKLPLLLWHGGGLTASTTRPSPTDSRAGSITSCARVSTSTSPTPWNAAAPAGATRWRA